jgi:hypothetical protein
MTLVETASGRVVWRSSVGNTPDAVSLRLTPALVVVNAGRELVVVDRRTGVARRTEELGMVMHDAATVGTDFVVLLDVEATGAVARVDWEVAAASPLH